jgi:hypothetical protein
MASNRDVMFRTRAPFARHHHEFAIGPSDPEHLFRRVAIERAEQPPNEVDRCRSRQPVFGGHAIDIALDTDMRCSLDLQVSPLFILVKFSREPPLDVFGARGMAIDQTLADKLADHVYGTPPRVAKAEV